VLLAAFELSPAPFALGVLEAAWLGLSLVPGLAVPGIMAAFAYRVWRGVPVLLLTWFYLPRYKMTVSDLYDPNLADALALSHRHRPHDARPRGGGPFVSFVLPAFNEEARLPVYLPQVQEFCHSLAGPSEIVIVDDGSTDGTAAYVESVTARDPSVRLVKQPYNQGKGAAVRRGVTEAHGDYILFADSDGATPIAEAAKLIEACLDGADVVIGSRKAEGAGAQRSRSLIRGMIGSMFYRITNLLAVPDILDTQCGFKLFRRSAAQMIFPLLREKGWAFDVEILFLAQKFGMKISEVPVNWTAVEGSKVKASDGLRFFIALFRIRHRTSGLTGSSNPASAHPTTL
jgi:dolichyl-phosphate beta-glucosyltransferase